MPAFVAEMSASAASTIEVMEKLQQELRRLLTVSKDINEVFEKLQMDGCCLISNVLDGRPSQAETAKLQRFTEGVEFLNDALQLTIQQHAEYGRSPPTGQAQLAAAPTPPFPSSALSQNQQSNQLLASIAQQQQQQRLLFDPPAAARFGDPVTAAQAAAVSSAGAVTANGNYSSHSWDADAVLSQQRQPLLPSASYQLQPRQATASPPPAMPNRRRLSDAHAASAGTNNSSDRRPSAGGATGRMPPEAPGFEISWELTRAEPDGSDASAAYDVRSSTVVATTNRDPLVASQGQSDDFFATLAMDTNPSVPLPQAVGGRGVDAESAAFVPSRFGRGRGIPGSRDDEQVVIIGVAQADVVEPVAAKRFRASLPSIGTHNHRRASERTADEWQSHTDAFGASAQPSLQKMRADYPRSHEPDPDEPPLDIQRNKYEAATEFVGMLSDPEPTPSRFWIHLTESCVANTQIRDLLDDIGVSLREAGALSGSQLQVGRFCASIYPVEENAFCFYRARIEKLESNRDGVAFAKVLFIDHGNSAWIMTDYLRQFPYDEESQLKFIPWQANCCLLKGVRPASGEVWSQDALDAFKGLLSGIDEATDELQPYKLKVLIDDVNDDHLHMVSLEDADEQGSDIAQQLIGLGFAMADNSSGFAQQYASVLDEEDRPPAGTGVLEFFWMQLPETNGHGDQPEQMSE